MSATVAAGLLVAAGTLHFVLAPTHMAEARAQGLFFLVLATVQVVLGLLVLRHLSGRVCYAGILVSGASLMLWVITRFTPPPFGDEIDSLDILAITTKVLETATLLLFVYLLLWRASVTRPMPRRARAYVAIVVVGSFVLGAAAYGAGVASEGITWLGKGEEHTHSHTDAAGETPGHTHSTTTDPHAGHTTAAPA